MVANNQRERRMRGGQVFMDGLVAHGVDCIFGNPGTTENSLLDRLIDFPELRYYVTLHEGVAVGAANFYAQASGKTGIVNLHVAPGLGNGIGMMYAALKANTPLIVTAGQQDTRMRLRDPLLGHDLVAIAQPVTKWSAEPRSADEIGPMLRRAFKIANDPPRGPVFMALPVDVLEQETQVGAETSGDRRFASVADPAGLDTLADLLVASVQPAIIVGDDVATEGAHQALITLVERAGCAVFTQGSRVQSAFPNQHPNFRGGLGYEAGAIAKSLAPFDLLLLLGGQFFEELWYDVQSPLPTGIRVVQIESSHARLAANLPLDLGLVGNLAATLPAVDQALTARANTAFTDAVQTRNANLAKAKAESRDRIQQRLDAHVDAVPMTPANAIDAIRSALPAGTIVVDESITASLEVGSQFDFDNPGDLLHGAGGGIGQGVAGAIGVQVAQPSRRVLAISGDGSAMYSIQALWSAAHHNLPIVFVILSNREYRILKHNIDVYRSRFDVGSNKPYPHMDLTNPTLEFSSIAAGMGVQGELVENLGSVAEALSRAFAENKPYLLEIVVSGKR
jgi:benzoylformate decarboxylase